MSDGSAEGDMNDMFLVKTFLEGLDNIIVEVIMFHPAVQQLPCYGVTMVSLRYANLLAKLSFGLSSTAALNWLLNMADFPQGWGELFSEAGYVEVLEQDWD